MIDVDVVITDEVAELYPINPGRLKKHAVYVLKSSGILVSDVTIIFIDDTEMSVLNEKYKGCVGSTDVLSFILSEKDSDKVEGEVYISLEKAQEQSIEYDVPLPEEVVRLVTHGLLHLSGRDDESEEAYNAMVEDTEKYIEHYFTNGVTD